MLFKFVLVILEISVWLAVFSIGARASFADLTFLFRKPREFLRAMTAIFVVVPVTAIVLSLVFKLTPEIKFTLVALSVSPIPPALHLKQIKLGAREDYVVGLLAAASLVALIVTPVLLVSGARILGSDVTINPGEVARVVAMTIAFPLITGIALHRISPHLAGLLSPYASRIADISLKVGSVVLLVVAWRGIAPLLGNGAILAIAVTVGMGLLAGHMLGSEHGNTHAALALAAAARHPGVAMAIAAANFPDKQKSLTAAILLFVVVSGLMTGLYVRWIKRQHKIPAAFPAAR